MSNNKYPQYISTAPTGEDLLDGKSQTKISTAIAEHIKYIDSLSNDDKLTPKMPRVIGIEGKWGSGKSNVLQRLEFKDFRNEPTYKFFTYDAWANQEDLQRRTILEQLTANLIDRHLLNGKVKVRMQKADKNNEFHTVDEMVTWKEKLDLLMAKRVRNITRSATPLNTEFKLFMLTLALTPMFITLMNALKFNDINGWCFFGITIVVALLPTIISTAIIALNKNLCFNNVLKAYQATTENKTTHQVVNEAEPTIQEFSDWMKEISDGLKNFKLVVIFDNMDRLPADKVKKLWSSIHSIFATEEYKNIWCIIPYDFGHLSCAFGNSETEREQLTKYFIDKSFPVVYRVPEPIVIDYKKIFNSFFVQAFGTALDERDTEIINRCYRITYPKPNIRSIISFINRMVTLTKVYGTDITPISVALYLLREDDLLKHPTTIVTDASSGDKIETKERPITTDEYILSDTFLSGFEKIIQDKNNLQKEIAALVYGVDPEKAYQLPMYNALKRCFEENESQISLNTFVKHPLFASVLIEIVHQIDTTYYQNVTIKLSEINTPDIPEEAQASIQRSWNYLADQYVRLKTPVQKYTPLEKNILNHVNEEKRKLVAKGFCTMYTSDETIKGDDLFNTLIELTRESFANNWDINDICPKTKISAEQFVSYVKAAKQQYYLFPVSTDSKELNKFLSERISSDEDCLEIIEILSKDKKYDVKLIADNAVEKLTKESDTYTIVVRLLHVIKLFYPKIDINLTNDYLLSIWQKMKQNEKDIANPSEEYKELYVFLAVSYPGNLQNEPQFANVDMAERTLFYCSTSKLIHLALQYPNDSAIQGLLLASLLNKVTDNNPVIKGGFVSTWNKIVTNNPNITISHLCEFAEAWGYNDIVEEEANISLDQLLPVHNWIDDIMLSQTHIAQALINKSVNDVKSLSADNFYNMQNLSPSNSYWYKIYLKLMTGDVITNPIGENFERITIQALHLYAKNIYPKCTAIHKLLELGFGNYAQFASEFNDIIRKIFLKADGYVVTPQNFTMLHKWIEKTDINERGHINDSADTILAPIIEDVTCQNIILSNKRFYQPIIVGSKETSSALHNKLRKLVNSKNDTEFIQYIDSIVRYEKDEDSPK